MVTVYEAAEGVLIKREGPAAITPAVVWIDLLIPTKDEEESVELALAISMPTREEMSEIDDPDDRARGRADVAIAGINADAPPTDDLPRPRHGRARRGERVAGTRQDRRPRRAIPRRSHRLPLRQDHVPARGHAGHDQQRAERHHQDLLGVGGSTHAADAGRYHLRHELQAHAAARVGLGLPLGAGADGRLGRA